MKWSAFFIVTLIILLPQPLLSSHTQSFDDCCVNQPKLTDYALASNGYINVNVSEAKQMIESNPYLVILDVRTLEEYKEGHIENAVWIPVTELESRLHELDTVKETLVYCKLGGRSATASQILVDNGFTSVYNMVGGITAWRNEGYWIEIIHEGDLIIDGTQTYVIENCTCVQKGNVRVSDIARIIIRNAIFKIEPQDYWHQFEFWVGNQARLEILNSTMNVPQGAWLNCGGNSRVNINQSSLEGMPLGAGGNSNIIIDDTSYRSGLHLSGEFKITVLNSTINDIVLNLAPPSHSRIEGLKPGYFDYLNLHQNQSGVDVGYELTLVDSFVSEWGLNLARHDVGVFVSDSALASVWICYSGVTTKIDGVKNGRYYEHMDINNLELRNTSVSDFTFAVSDSQVELRNTTARLHLFEGTTNVSIYDSDLSFLARGEETDRSIGVLLLNGSSLIGEGFLNSELYIHGNVTRLDWSGDWVSTTATRNFNVIVEDLSDIPVANAELALLDQNDTVVWNGVSNNLGVADFNLTFTDNNYTGTFQLDASKEGFYQSPIYLVEFPTDTPIQITLTEKPVGDLNEDRTVNIIDISIVAVAFGCKLGDENYNEIADMDKNEEINIVDVSIVALDYGKTV